MPSNPNPSDDLLAKLEELEKVTAEKANVEKLQKALLKIARLSSQVSRMRDFYQDLHIVISELINATNFYVALLTSDKQFVKFEYFYDEEDIELDPTSWEPEPIEAFKSTLTGYLFKTEQTLLLDEKLIKDLIDQGEISMRGKPTNHWLGVPLMVNNEMIGVMVTQTYDPDQNYTSQDKEVLTFVSQQVAAVLSQNKYQQQLRAYNEQLEFKVLQRTEMLQQINQDLEEKIREVEQSSAIQNAVFKISELANSSAELDEFYLSLHKIIDSIMHSKNFYICLYNSKTERLTFPYIIDEFDNDLFERDLKKDKPLEEQRPTERVLLSGQPLLINEENNSKWLEMQVIVGTFPETWLGVPLLKDSEAIGVLAIQSYVKGKSYTDLDKEILMYVGQQVATTIIRKKSTDALKKAHQKLKKANDELEKRVEERTNELSITNNTLKSMLDERNKMQKKLAFEAFHDNLTGLPNRALFINRLEQCIKQQRRNDKADYSVLFLDLDRFKVINDSLGHLVGDELLKQVAGRLEDCIRPQDTVARLGGDEFCILLRDVSDYTITAKIAERIVESIQEPFQVDESIIHTSTSVGVVIGNLNHLTSSDVLRDADSAMYHAKDSGKSRYVLFDAEMHQAALKRLKIESELRNAIKNHQISVYYQPILDLQTGHVVAFEALSRWFHEELGFISPAEFIPIAEETGLIHEIGLYVLHHSLGKLKYWRTLDERFENIAMSVNVSSQQIENRNLLDEIEMALQENQLPHSALKVEITESLLIENAELAEQLLSELTKRGVKVLMDDFGTGFSALSYLHKFSLSTIKIDRSFIKDMEANDKNMAIVSSIAFMCEKLNLDIIAEGVEEQVHVEILKELSINQAQGFLFSKPVDSEAAFALAQTTNR